MICHSEHQVYIIFAGVSLVLRGRRSLNADWLTKAFIYTNADFVFTVMNYAIFSLHSVQKFMVARAVGALNRQLMRSQEILGIKKKIWKHSKSHGAPDLFPLATEV